MSSSSGNVQDSKFFLDPEDVLGFGFQQYSSNIRGLALSKPGEYYKLRAEVMKQVKVDACRNLYTTIFNILSKGRKFDGGSIGVFGTGDYVPNFPSHKINDFSISVAAQLGESLNKIIDILLPDDFTKLASSKLEIQGKASSIDV